MIFPRCVQSRGAHDQIEILCMQHSLGANGNHVNSEYTPNDAELVRFFNFMTV
jgi:hypothetical protein